jgi:hypothetical protein
MSNYIKRIVSGWGVEYRDEHGRHHCEDGPAIIAKNGIKKWFKHGEYHNTTGPALIWTDGSVMWWVNDVEIRVY